MIFNTSSAEVLDHDLDKSTSQAFLKQIAYAFFGLILFYIGCKTPYKKWIETSPFFLGLLTFFLIIVLIPGIGREVNGSRRWLSLFGLSFQPSEFVKIFLPAFFIYQIRDKWAIHFKEFVKLITICSIPIFLILIEPNNGTAGVIGLSMIVLCILKRVPFRYWALPLCILSIIGGISAYNHPYFSARIKVYLNPELDLRGKGHQPYQAKIAAGSGGILGRGPGNSLQKMSYLPEAQNDYIAAIYAEEFGFIGIVVLIFFYLLIGYIGYSIAFNSLEIEAFILAACLTFFFCFQAFLNLGVVSGLVPSTGLNLPLFSQGGSSLMANLFSLGILTQIGSKKVECQDSIIN